MAILDIRFLSHLQSLFFCLCDIVIASAPATFAIVCSVNFLNSLKFVFLFAVTEVTVNAQSTGDQLVFRQRLP